MGGETRGQSAGRRSEPEVAGVSESNFVAVNIREAKKLSLSRGRRSDKYSGKKTENGSAKL
jgi:hypothetical protein